MSKGFDDKLFYQEMQDLVEADKLYKLRNDAKFRAVVQAKNYDEFRGIVDAAHLSSLSKEDKTKHVKTNWNKAMNNDRTTENN